jgi:hypothetical protein
LKALNKSGNLIVAALDVYCIWRAGFGIGYTPHSIVYHQLNFAHFGSQMLGLSDGEVSTALQAQ